MTPLINGEGYIKALEFHLKLAKTGPDAQEPGVWVKPWIISCVVKPFLHLLGDVGSLVQDEARSKIKGK
jgi:hypothetical protein